MAKGRTASNEESNQLHVAVDLVIFTVRGGKLQVLLIERGNDPFLGQPALPGGFVRPKEDLERAARRELKEETGLSQNLYLEQVRSYGKPDRDPRFRVVSVAHLAIAPNLPDPKAATDARDAWWRPVDDVIERKIKLAFDHFDIVCDAVERARGKFEYTPLATEFCGKSFTIGELRHIYEVVWGFPLDPRNFNRKVTRSAGFVVATGEKRYPDVGRPAALYRRGDAEFLYPPMTRATANSDT